MKFGKRVCENIRLIRKSMKLTQSQFAELAGLSEDSVGKIERGDTVPTIDTLYKISSGLKMPVEQLLSAEKQSPSAKSNREVEDFVSYLMTRPPDHVKFIHKLAIQILEKMK